MTAGRCFQTYSGIRRQHKDSNCKFQEDARRKVLERAEHLSRSYMKSRKSDFTPSEHDSA